MSAKVFLTRRMPDIAVEVLRAGGCTVEMAEQDSPLPRAELLQRVRGCDAAITMLSERVDREFLDAAGPELKVVANYAVGFDNIDLEACRERGVRVTNTPGVLTDATADLTWALILATARRVVEGDRLLRSEQWDGWKPLELRGLQLSEATLGIVGAGRIGTAVAVRALGFRCHLLYCHPRRNEQMERWATAHRVELDQLLERSDIVTLHVPMRAENRHLLDARRIGLLKPGAILINTARGPLVDEQALVAALRDRRLAAAGLDVYENEPRLAPGLAELDNVVLLPHLGSATVATRDKMARMAADSIVAVLSSRTPEHVVV